MQSKLSRASSLTGMSTEINRVHLVRKECKTMWRTKCEDFKGDVGCHLLFQYWKAIFVVSVFILALLFMTNNQPKTEHCYAVQTVLCDLLRFEHFRCPSSSHMFVCVLFKNWNSQHLKLWVCPFCFRLCSFTFGRIILFHRILYSL